nr:MAG TPA: hypothetical protein [Caudoviricetes sp.]
MTIFFKVCNNINNYYTFFFFNYSYYICNNFKILIIKTINILY